MLSVKLRAKAPVLVMALILMGALLFFLQNRDVADPQHRNLLALGKSLPLFFEANNGQTDSEVKFLARRPGYLLRFKNDRIETVSARRNDSSQLTLQFINAQSATTIEGLTRLSGESNYLAGNDATQWHTSIPHYQSVKYHNLYRGIDLIYYGHDGQNSSANGEMEYDFIVQPQANVDDILLNFDYQLSSQSEDNAPLKDNSQIKDNLQLKIDEHGDLLIETAMGTIRKLRPQAYQDINGERKIVTASYLIYDNHQRDHQIKFQLGAYDHNYPLIIDPVVNYASYFGGKGSDEASAVAVDSSGNLYMTGITTSLDLKLSGGVQKNNKGSFDIFIAKINADGNGLVYATYLGGSSIDQAFGLAIDGQGSAYIVGSTTSKDFPTTKPLQDKLKGGTFDGFIVKLNAAGNSLNYATYLGGSDDDEALSVAVNSRGEAFIAGTTSSVDFPVNNGMPRPGGDSDAFVARLSANGDKLIYSGYLGGSDEDDGTAIAIDLDDNAYIAGSTFSTNFPKISNPDAPPSLNNASTTPQADSNNSDAFVTRFDSTGKKIIYSTVMGGSADDEALSIAVDSFKNAYITGRTLSANYPVAAGNIQGTSGGGQDAFITQITETGFFTFFSSYLGGSGNDVGNSIVVDGEGNFYVVGSTSSPNFPVKNGLPGSTSGGRDAFLIKGNVSGAVDYNTLLGGKDNDEAFAVALDSNKNVYVAGVTLSTDLALQQPLQSSNAGATDAFMAKIVPSVDVTPDFLLSFGPSSDSIDVGQEIEIPINSRAINGFNSDIMLTAQTTSTAAVTATLTNNTIMANGSTSVRLKSSATAQAGTFTLTLTGTSGAITRTITKALRINVPVPDFQISFDMSQITLKRGKNVSASINISRFFGLTDTITIVAPSIDKKMRLIISPAMQSTAGNNVSFDLKAKKRAPKGTQTLTFTATDQQGRARNASLTLVIN